MKCTWLPKGLAWGSLESTAAAFEAVLVTKYWLQPDAQINTSKEHPLPAGALYLYSKPSANWFSAALSCRYNGR